MPGVTGEAQRQQHFRRAGGLMQHERAGARPLAGSCDAARDNLDRALSRPEPPARPARR